METYSRFWAVLVTNHGDTFYTNVWRDTAKGAERSVRAMYPNAELIVAEQAD
jgi:hypothetical protein